MVTCHYYLNDLQAEEATDQASVCHKPLFGIHNFPFNSVFVRPMSQGSDLVHDKGMLYIL